MYLVKTYLDYSPIHGIGVFAGEDIPAGTIVWQLFEGIDRAIDPQAVESFPAPAQRFVRTYGYMNEGQWRLCGDHGIFCNHDDDPNTLSREDGTDVATRAIQLGEEITCNYRQFDGLAMEKLAAGGV
jgi:uncharacterized protein